MQKHKYESKENDPNILKLVSSGEQNQANKNVLYAQISQQSILTNPTVSNPETKVSPNDEPPLMVKANTSSCSDILVHNTEASSEILYSRTQPASDEQAQNISNFQQQPAPASTTVIKTPSLIEKIKEIFGVSKDVEEIKMSITKEKYLEKSFQVGKKKLHNRKLAPVIIWDFGGQDVFYSTHQTFLTYRALYIIVLDGSRNLDDPCPFEQYLPGKSGTKTPRGTYRSILVDLCYTKQAKS